MCRMVISLFVKLLGSKKKPTFGISERIILLNEFMMDKSISLTLKDISNGEEETKFENGLSIEEIRRGAKAFFAGTYFRSHR